MISVKPSFIRFNKITAFNKLYFGALGALLLSAVLPASANMQIYPMQTELGVRGTAQIRVMSKSDEVQFVSVTSKQILNPGTAQEKEVPVEMTAQSALVVTPNKLALSAGSERIVRLIAMTPPPKETTWRVYFEGVKNDPGTFPTTAGKSNNRSAEIGVSIVWGALVHIAPETVRPSLKFNAKTGKVINDGTLRLPLREIGICDAADACSWQKETATVYPDTELQLGSLKAQTGKTYRAKYYHWINKSVEEIIIPVLLG